MPEPAALRQLRLDGGPADGSRLIEVANAAGLTVDLLPDRCLDLGQVRLNGLPFAWVGPNGLAPAAPGEMDQALGGLMCTCGFDHIRQPEAQGGRRYPLHGSMSLRRAQVEAACVGPDGSAEIRARVAHGIAGGASWTLLRRITIPADRAEIAIEDEVALRSPADGDRVMALYHVNLGPPLVGPDTVVTVAGQPRPDLPGSAPGTFCEPAPPGATVVEVGRGIGDARVLFRLEAAADQLPWLQFHRRIAPDGGLFCVEPATHDRRPRTELAPDGPGPEGTVLRRFRLLLRFGHEMPSAPERSGQTLSGP